MSNDLMLQIAQTLAQLDRRLARLEVGETGAGGTMSGSAILTAIKTVDGSGSGLDADFLDGISSAGYLGTASASSFVGTASYTAADVLSKLLTVDGSASLLDADTVDGFHASSMGAMTAADILTAIKTVDGNGSGLDADLFDGHEGNYWVTALSYTDAAVLSKLLNVDGTASLLDADKLDGLEGSAYSGTAHTHSEFSVAYLKSDGSTPLTGAWNAGTQAVTLGSTLNVSGVAEFGTSMNVNPAGGGSVSFGTVTGNTPLFLYGDLSAYGAANLWSTLDVTGATTIGGTATLTGGATLGAPIDTSGTATLLEYRQGGTSIFRTGRSAAASYMRLGLGRAADGDTYFDLIGDTTYTAFGLRFIRNTGANGASQLAHRGTGVLQFRTTDAADIEFQTSATARMWIMSDGLVKVENSLAVNGDYGGTTGYTTFTDVTAAASTGTVTVKSRTASNVNSTGFIKLYVGTVAKYVPYVD